MNFKYTINDKKVIYMSKFKSKKGLILSVGAVLAGISLTTIVASCAPTIAKKTTPTQNQKVETNKEVSTTKTTQDQPVIKDNQVSKEQIQDTKQTESK